MLASTLLAAAETHEKTRPPPASSGLLAIDQLVLDGGFRYGEITSIAGAGDVGKTAVGFAFSVIIQQLSFCCHVVFLLYVVGVLYRGRHSLRSLGSASSFCMAL